MGKFFKSLVGLGVVTAAAAGVYLAYKAYQKEEEYDAFDDEDYASDDDLGKDRNYVNIDIEASEGEDSEAGSSEEKRPEEDSFEGHTDAY